MMDFSPVTNGMSWDSTSNVETGLLNNRLCRCRDQRTLYAKVFDRDTARKNLREARFLNFDNELFEV